MSRRAAIGLALIVGPALSVGCLEARVEPAAGASSCEGCHRPIGEDGTPHGIEVAHREYALACEDCHGGDPRAPDAAASHVGGAVTGSAISRFSADELDELAVANPDRLRFLRPTDFRVASRSCGGGSTADGGGSGCHEDIVRSASTSAMATMAGHFGPSRFLAGTQPDLLAHLGPVAVAVPDCNSAALPPGAVCSVDALKAWEHADDIALGPQLERFLSRRCSACHLWAAGLNRDPGDYRSAGCAGCHMPTAYDGVGRTDDPALPAAWKELPSHPERHALTTAVPDAQCEHCHYVGARVGPHYRGWTESGAVNDEDLYPAPLRFDEPLHGNPAGFYVIDPDETNDFDETPPNVHHLAGLGCVDCHGDHDVHGDGNLYANLDLQVTVRCESCHGSAELDPPGPPFIGPAGSELDNLEWRSGSECIGLTYYDGRSLAPTVGFTGCLVLVSKLDGRPHPVTVLRRLDYRIPCESLACLVHARGALNGHVLDEAGAPRTDLVTFSHLDSLKCYTCHNAWSETCFGCHAGMDDRGVSYDPIAGVELTGEAVGRKGYVSLHHVLLGRDYEDKVSLMFPSERLFFSWVDPTGSVLLDRVVRTSAEGLPGMNYAPMHAHTTQLQSLTCDRCHLLTDESNAAAVLEALGYGSGRYMATDGGGGRHDLSRALAGDGTPAISMGHWGAGTLPTEMIDRMLSIRVPLTFEGAISPAWPRPGAFPPSILYDEGWPAPLE